MLLSGAAVVTKVLVWLMLLYGPPAALPAAADAELLEACLDGIGCVGGDGNGRATDLGDVEEVERERVTVTGMEAD